MRTLESIGLLLAGLLLSAVANAGDGLLEANGVSTSKDAADYYRAIDPLNLRTTQGDWKAVNGFNDPVNAAAIVSVRGHYNKSDLGFFRRIDMLMDQRAGKAGNVAMTTYNFLSAQGSGGPNACCDEKDAVSVVNMEYSPIEGVGIDKIVKFYIYKYGVRTDRTVFDHNLAGAKEFILPNGCASCHGGGKDFRVRNGDTGGRFLAFDFAVFDYSHSAPETQANNEAKVKKLNTAVSKTNPGDAVKGLIYRLYGGNTLPSPVQLDPARPPGWTGPLGATTAEALWDVVRQDCQGCHTLSEEDILSLRYWRSSARSIRELVSKEKTMPNSIEGNRRFNDPANTHNKDVVDAALAYFGAP